jgi:hypothetical protein
MIVYRKRITDDEQKVMAIYYVALSLARQVKNKLNEQIFSYIILQSL